MNRFQRNTLLLILGAMLVAVGQVFMIREQNLGAEKGLMNLSNRIEESMINAQALISQVDDSIDKKEQMLVHSTHLDWAGYEKLSQTLQTQGVDFFVYEFGQPVFWSTQNYQISPNFEKPIELQKQGNMFGAVYHKQRDGKSFAYVLPLIEAKEISYTQSSVFRDNNVVEYSISRNPVENSTPVIVPDMELFYLVVSNYQHPYWFDILFLLGALMISSAVFGMTKSSKFHLLAVGAIFGSWLGVYSLFSHGYTLETLRSTPLFSHELFFASQSGGSLGEFIFITVLGLFVVSSLVRWLEQWILKSEQPLAGFVLSNLAMQASLWMLVWLLLNGVNLVHLGRINLDFQQFHRLTLFSFVAVATLAVQWVA
ncbi:MAG: hypothetical protein WCH09_09430, partial [Bacteroidota bacterium]